jgi:hypothetical protein
MGAVCKNNSPHMGWSSTQLPVIAPTRSLISQGIILGTRVGHPITRGYVCVVLGS